MTTRKNKPGAGRPAAIWSPAKIDKLKQLYPATDNEIIAKKLKVTVSAVRNKAALLGLKKAGWSDQEIMFMRESFTTLTYEKIAKRLGKTKWQVINKARELKLTEINNLK